MQRLLLMAAYYEGARPPPRPGVDGVKRECELMKKQIECMKKALKDLEDKNKNGCNDKCIKVINRITFRQERYIRQNCPEQKRK
jgi:hypothetical protein